MNLKTNFVFDKDENKPMIPLPTPEQGTQVPEGNDNTEGQRPIIPLPNPGEGGPVYPGGNENIPIIPLPNPGEGGPVYPGGNENIPVIPLPNPGEGGPVYPGGNENIPVIPLPNPGEGGPVYPGGITIPGIIGTIITTYPRPNSPCRFCLAGETRSGNIRFLNAASDYNPFMVYINDELFVNPLNYAEVTEYQKVPMGYQTITIMGQDGYIYIQKPVMIPNNGVMTIAVINTQSGLDLFVISDAPCSRPTYVSCIRACNLSANSGPLNLVIGDQYVTFMNVAYKEVTGFKTIWPGEYNYYVSRSNNMQFQNLKRQNIILSSSINVQANVNYTVYMFNWNKNSKDAIRVLIVEEH